MNKDKLLTQFEDIFQTKETPRAFFAPGRINLIGEHTDYNGGHVLPAAISLGTYALVTKRNDQKMRFYSCNLPEYGVLECDLSDTTFQENHHWMNYPKGMVHYLLKDGHPINEGLDVLFYGNIPYGAGLSSSASIEMVMGTLVNELFQLNIQPIDLVYLGKKVENKYIGVQSGIMDQFTIGMGKKDHAILLNTNTMDYEYTPIKLQDHVIMIMNTNKQRSLADSKYNERRKECEQALVDLQQEVNIQDLCELTGQKFEEHNHLIQSDTHKKRAKHAVYENERTLQAYEQLQKSNFKNFGKLMNESHESLQHDYMVTGLALDTIVQAAWDQSGVLGARMTGAGFGGCALALVEKNKTKQFMKNVNEVYREKVGVNADFYQSEISDGAKEISF